MKIELHSHQKDALSKIHNGCVLWGGVGTGKTITALAYALEKEKGRKVIVVTTAKKRDSYDWQNEAALMGFPFEDIQVTSWNKIGAFVDYEEHLFLFDEQRLVGKGAWVKTFYKIAKKNRWILLSGTPGDTWSDYIPIFIGNGFYRTQKEFNDRHVVWAPYVKFPQVQRYLEVEHLEKLRDSILVEMPMERHTKRHFKEIKVGYDKELLDYVRKKRWNVFEDKPCRNAAELFNVLRKVVGSDSSRTEVIRNLLNRHDRLIVFYNFNYELEMLRELLSTYSQNLAIDRDIQAMKSDSEIMPRPSDSTPLSRVFLDESQKLKSAGYEIPYPELTWRELYTQIQSTLFSNKDFDELKWILLQLIDEDEFAKTEANRTEEKIVDSFFDTTKQADVNKSFAWAEWNGHKHQPIPDTDRWVYLVQYISGSEGWNCTSTDAMAFWSLTYSYKQYEQAQGRIDRMNTPFVDLWYYILLTDSFAEKPVLQALVDKKDFQPSKHAINVAEEALAEMRAEQDKPDPNLTAKYANAPTKEG